MVKVRAFQGFVAKKELAQNLISPPYDVLDTNEAKEMAKGNEVGIIYKLNLTSPQVSFLHVNKPEIDLPEDTDPYDEKVYYKGKENLEKFVKNGWIQEEKESIVYIYSQKMGSIQQYGLMLEASVDVKLFLISF